MQGICTVVKFLLTLLVASLGHTLLTYRRPCSEDLPVPHWSCRLSRIWLVWHRIKGDDTSVVHRAHAQSGGVVQLSPFDISVNSLDDRKIIHDKTGAWCKTNWYREFSAFGVSPLFAMTHPNPHRERRKQLSGVFRNSSLLASPAVKGIVQRVLHQLKDRLDSDISTSGGVDVEGYHVVSAVAMDLITAFVFGCGNGTNFVDAKAYGAEYFESYNVQQKRLFWTQAFPGINRFLRATKTQWLVYPGQVDCGQTKDESRIREMCAAANESSQNPSLRQEEVPVLFAHFKGTHGASKHNDSLGRGDTICPHVLSEMFDFTAAGYHTTAITLVWFAWQVSRPENASWQTELRKELVMSRAPLKDFAAIDRLKVLDAMINETIRLHPAVSGSQPRVASSSDCSLSSGLKVTEGTTVHTQASSLHRNSDVFDTPESWCPGRWLNRSDTDLRKMNDHLWAFGSGEFGCIGRHLAKIFLKTTILGIWKYFRTTVIDARGMAASGGYNAVPSGFSPAGAHKRYLRLSVERIE